MKNICVGIIGGKGRLGKEIAKLCKKPVLIQKSSSIDNEIKNIDIFIDVSTANAICNYLPTLIKNKKPIIIGSTGHNKKTLKTLKNATTKIPVLIAPNFSLGIYLLHKLLQQIELAPTHIIETHHTQKKDKPSGTAKALNALYTKDIPITSIRKDNAFGKHCISYLLEEEEITITHKAHSRKLFAKGAIEAASFLYQKPKGLYTMDDVYKEKL